MTEELNSNEILRKFQQEIGQGNEPLRELLSLNNISGRSIILKEERMLLTQLRFISVQFELKIIDELIIRPYLEYGLSVDGLSRQQFTEAHKGLLDNLKPDLAGQDDNAINPLSSKNRKT